MSQGAYALKRTGLTQQQIAARLKVNQSTVARWLKGEKLPGVAARNQMLAEFSIAVDLWGKPHKAQQSKGKTGAAKPPAKAGKGKPKAAPKPSEGADVRSRALKLGELVDGLIEEAGEGAPAERAAVIDRAARALSVLGKITGETGDVTVPTILSSPHWRRIEDVIVSTLSEHDLSEVARQIAARLEALE